MAQTLTISKVTRVHGRANLTLSTGETLSMPRAMLKERPYRGGMPFDRASHTAFIRDRSYPFALDKAVSLLALRARTEKEIRDSLRLCAYPEETIERVMARLGEAGYLNDADFAVSWSASRLSKGMGARRISQELSRKGVDRETISAAIDELDEDDVFASAMKTARKAASGKDLASPSDRQKITAALLRRGFDYGIVRRALDTLRSGED
ncbi:MAG: regulatory protein RecX [Clostridia bacterium]|nr:regulatory protein RecX [Clostridia bacterium]